MSRVPQILHLTLENRRGAKFIINADAAVTDNEALFRLFHLSQLSHTICYDTRLQGRLHVSRRSDERCAHI